MFVVRLFGKFGHQVLPAVCATVISTVVLSVLNLTSAPSAQQRGSAEDTVYIDVLPRINRDPQTPVVAKVQPPAVEEAALVEPPAATPPHQDAPPPAGRERARAPVTARTEPALAAKVEPAVKPEPAPLAPPMSIVNAEPQPQPDEPHRVFGLAVPTPVTRVGGAVVEVAKVPVKVADAVAVRPAVWVGEKIVQGVGGIAGWIIPGR